MEHAILTSMRKFIADATPECKVRNDKHRPTEDGLNRE